MKNLAIMGGLLMVAVYGPGGYSLSARSGRHAPDVRRGRQPLK